MTFRREILFLSIIIFFFIFISQNYFNSQYAVLDRVQWFKGTKSFYNAITNYNFGATAKDSVMGHPGVTLVWLSSLAFYIQNHFLNTQDVFIFFKLQNLIVIFIISFLSVLNFYLLYRLFGSKIVAFLSIIYISLNQYFLAPYFHTWLDVILMELIFTSALFWGLYLISYRKTFIIFTGFFLGLSFLTKLASFFFIPLFFMLWLAHNKIFYKKIEVFKGLFSISIVSFIGYGVAYLLYPALWYNPLLLIFKRFRESSYVYLTVEQGTKTLDFYPKQASFFDPLVFSSAILIILSIFFFFKKKKRYLKKYALFIGLYFLGIAYIVVLTIITRFLRDLGSGEAAFFSNTNRYLLPILPFVTIPFFGLSEMIVKNKYSNFYTRKLSIMLYILLFSIEVYNLIKI